MKYIMLVSPIAIQANGGGSLSTSGALLNMNVQFATASHCPGTAWLYKLAFNWLISYSLTDNLCSWQKVFSFEVMRMYMTKLVFVAIAALCVCCNASQPCKIPDSLEKSFLKNCKDEGIKDGKCHDAWIDFSGAFGSKPPGEVEMEDYNAYFDRLPLKLHPNSVLFWSGTYGLVDIISQRTDETSSSFTEQSSRIVNNLGRTTPWCEPKNDRPSDRFWAAFSTKLGTEAQRIVFWIAAGESKDRKDGKHDTYRKSSFFSQYELPALKVPRVSKLVVIDVHRKGVGEACGKGTLIDLENEVLGKSITYQCEEVYGDPRTTDLDERQRLAKQVITIIRREQTGQ